MRGVACNDYKVDERGDRHFGIRDDMRERIQNTRMAFKLGSAAGLFYYQVWRHWWFR